MTNLSIARWLSLILGILMIISSVINILNPIESTVAFVRVFSIILVGMGILRLIRYFSSNFFRTGSFLIGAILDIGLGIIMYLNLETSILAFVSLIGFWVLFNAMVEIAIAIDLKQINFKRWWLSLLAGIIGLAFGILLIGNLGLAAIYFVSMISAYLLINGITFISLFFGLKDKRE